MKPESRDVAIIGMACIYPKAPDAEKFWGNILSKVDAVTDAPDHWRPEYFFDPESTKNDRTYCKRGGFIDEYADFDPLEFGIMPGAVEGSDPEVFLALKVAKKVLEDAGYLERPFDRKRTAVILGHGNLLNRGLGNVFYHTKVINEFIRILKSLHPDTPEEDLEIIKRELKAGLPPFKADVCPGLISNLLSGMIANRLDLQGPNFVLDAACASSLIALDAGMTKLLDGDCDMAIVGGVQAYTSLPVYIIFSLLGALSRRGKIRPFDKRADGTLLGGGIGMMLIKRLADAERDGDRIYAVVKGIGISSDGKAQGALVPRLEGELLALERSYAKAEIPPRSIGLVEAHGTATRVGDATEIEALSRLFGERRGEFPDCALGSVKSMISHTIPAAGMAGLIKSALSLYHKVLPPTLCDEPNPDLGIEKTPFYLNTETRPWVHGEGHPRRAGVSAFGFGGINAHAILEEYRGNGEKKPLDLKWDSEAVILEAASRPELIEKGKCLLGFIAENPGGDLKDIAYSLNCALLNSLPSRLSIVAESLSDLSKKLGFALGGLADPACLQIKDRSGIFYFDKPLGREGKIAFLFPGEGAQYTNMLSDLCVHFPEVRRWFDRAERVFLKKGVLPSLKQVLFPPPHEPSEKKELAEKALWSMRYAVMSVCAADLAMHDFLGHLEIKPDAIAGHSIGQDVAVLASGIVPEDEELMLESYYENSTIRESDEADIPRARLMTVGGMASPDVMEVVKENEGELFVSMDNCPNQVILCGSEEAIKKAYEALVKKGAICAFLPFERAYHTPWYRPLCEHTERRIKGVKIQAPGIPVYSCSTAEPFPNEPDLIRRVMVDQWALPVRFRQTIEAMHDSGIRIFLEVGPRGNLTSFVEDTLRDRSFLAVPSNIASRSSITQVNTFIGLLAAHSVPMKLDYLYHNRVARRLSIPGLTSQRNEFGSISEQRKTPAGMRLELIIPHLALSEKVREDLHGNGGGTSRPLRARTPRIDAPAEPVRVERIAEKGSGEQVHSEILAEYQRTMGRLFAEKQTMNRHALSRIFWTAPLRTHEVAARLASCLCMGSDDALDLPVTVGQVLTEEEEEVWKNTGWPEERRRQWLFGRIAAKDALRYLLKGRSINAGYGEISVLNDKFGRPVPGGGIAGKLPLFISIAHSGPYSASIAGEGFNGMGIDIEEVGRSHDGLEEGGFSAGERSLIGKLGPALKSEWLLRLWCAKEALAKAIGRGMMGNPLNIVIENLDPDTGRVELGIKDELARELPDLAEKRFRADSGRDDVLVFATVLF